MGEWTWRNNGRVVCGAFFFCQEWEKLYTWTPCGYFWPWCDLQHGSWWSGWHCYNSGRESLKQKALPHSSFELIDAKICTAGMMEKLLKLELLDAVKNEAGQNKNFHFQRRHEWIVIEHLPWGSFISDDRLIEKSRPLTDRTRNAVMELQQTGNHERGQEDEKLVKLVHSLALFLAS